MKNCDKGSYIWLPLRGRRTARLRIAKLFGAERLREKNRMVLDMLPPQVTIRNRVRTAGVNPVRN